MTNKILYLFKNITDNLVFKRYYILTLIGFDVNFSLKQMSKKHYTRVRSALQAAYRSIQTDRA